MTTPNLTTLTRTFGTFTPQALAAGAATLGTFVVPEGTIWQITKMKGRQSVAGGGEQGRWLLSANDVNSTIFNELVPQAGDNATFAEDTADHGAVGLKIGPFENEVTLTYRVADHNDNNSTVTGSVNIEQVYEDPSTRPSIPSLAQNQ